MTEAELLTAIANCAEGGTVSIPAGSITITAMRDIPRGMTLQGAGEGSTTLLADAAWASAVPMFRVNNIDNVTFCDLTLDGNDGATVSGGVTYIGADGPRVERVTVRDFHATTGFKPIGVYLSGDCSNAVVDHVTCIDVGPASDSAAGIRGHGLTNSSITNCTITGSHRDGITLDSDGSDCVISDNVIEDAELAIEVNGDFARIVVERNQCSHFLSMSGTDESAIRNNTVGDADGGYQYGIELNGSDCVVTDNTVGGTVSGGGTTVGLSSSPGFAQTYVMLLRNTFDYCHQYAVGLDATAAGDMDYLFWGECEFTHCPVGGEGVLYSGSEGYGFRAVATAANIQWENCLFHGNGRAGAQFGANVDRLYFNGCEFTDNGTTPINAPSANWTAIEFDNCTATGNGTNNNFPTEIAFATALPTMTKSWPAGAAAGNAVALSVTAGVGVTLSHVLWDLGYGVPLTGTSVTATFPAPGPYTVTAVGWDTNGRAVRLSQTIYVDAGGATTMEILDGKTSADGWYPVKLVDETDGFTAETGIAAGTAATAYVAAPGATSWGIYTIGTADWHETGSGIYWLNVGASEFTAEGRWALQVRATGCRAYDAIVLVRDQLVSEMMDDTAAMKAGVTVGVMGSYVIGAAALATGALVARVLAADAVTLIGTGVANTPSIMTAAANVAAMKLGVTVGTGGIAANAFANYAIAAAALATGAVPARVLAADAIVLIGTGVWNATMMTQCQGTGAAGEALATVRQVLAGKQVADEGTNTQQVYDPNGSTLRLTLTTTYAAPTITRTPS